MLSCCGSRTGLDWYDGSSGSSGRHAVGGSDQTGTDAGTSLGGTAPAPGPQPVPEPALYSDPQYPYVEYSGGDGYQEFCPTYEGGWGMNCWHSDGATSRFCAGGGDCNVCSCTIPCGDNTISVDRCLPGATGAATAECVEETPNTLGSCMLTCDTSGPCPEGMLCVPYPGLDRSVCMWLAR